MNNLSEEEKNEFEILAKSWAIYADYTEVEMARVPRRADMLGHLRVAIARNSVAKHRKRLQQPA